MKQHIVENLQKALEDVAAEVDAQGYVLDASRIRGLADGLTCAYPHSTPKDALLAGEYLTGIRIGGGFFPRLSIRTMLRTPAIHA